MLVLSLVLLAGAMPVYAQRGMPSTLDQAVQQVRRTTNGRVLSAQTVTRQGRRVHRIKVLTDDGRVRTIEMSAGPMAGDRSGTDVNPALTPGLTKDPSRQPDDEKPARDRED